MSSAADLTAAEVELEALLTTYDGELGRDATAYGNHVRRVFGLVVAQAGGALTATELSDLAIAAVFHDIAIWLDGTFDYLDPSADHAAVHLRTIGRPGSIPRVRRIIELHHQLRPVRDDALVEAFRRADLCDLSFGRVRRGIPKHAWPALHARYAIAGFQLRLVQFTLAQLRTDPLRPLPMLRW